MLKKCDFNLLHIYHKTFVWECFSLKKVNYVLFYVVNLREFNVNHENIPLRIPWESLICLESVCKEVRIS